MKPHIIQVVLLCGYLGLGGQAMVYGQYGISITNHPDRSQVELRWPAKLVSPSGTSVYPVFEVQRSHDLKTWEPLGPRLRSGVMTGTDLQLALDSPGANAFFRVLGEAERSTLGLGGAEVFGYGGAFAAELKQMGEISLDAFAVRFTLTNQYLSRISWDPAQAQFWSKFDTNPNVKLNSAELAVFQTNGFVVSERLGSYSFADAYYKVFTNDLPVYISADAVLHAWHRSYVTMLEELENLFLAGLFEQILNGMAQQLPSVAAQYGQGALKESIQDVDYYLAVARSLDAGTPVPSYLNQDKQVADTLALISKLEPAPFPVFGRTNDVDGGPAMMDFSQFKVRSYYENSTQLSNYFRAMMWCGRVDFRIAGNPQYASSRELGAAVILNYLLQQSGQYECWLELDRLLQTFVGWTDSMTFAQLGDVLEAAQIKSPADIVDGAALDRLRLALEQGQVGVQNIRGEYYTSPLGPEQLRLPQSFTVSGQKFVLDSWAMSQVVFDSILWSQPWEGLLSEQGKVQRRIPSALDIAFAVLGNDQVVPELVARIADRQGRRFRDGQPYHHNLAAVRAVVDRHGTEAWSGNLYMNWLSVLRELSKPTTGPEYPECMRTRPWAMKTLNTQLASWTQLRHDTLLYAKQSYTGDILCSYPAGFVEPRPAFWQAMQDMAVRAGSLIASGTPWAFLRIDSVLGGPNDLTPIQSSEANFFWQFADKMSVLKGIAEKELSQQPLTAAETDFLGNVMEKRQVYSGLKRFSGWYPQLFYKVVHRTEYKQYEGSDRWDALVADVHTDVPALAVNDPGCVLHEGIGNVHMMMIAVDNGPDRMVYMGPVLSHYEFEMAGVTRKTDSEWKADVGAGRLPLQPEWTRSYLVPGSQPDYTQLIFGY